MNEASHTNTQCLDTAESFAEFANISVPYVRKLTRLKKIPFIRIGRAVRFERDAVLRALERTGAAEVVSGGHSK